jgi:hypothetical protein
MFEVINGKNSGFLGNSKIYIGRANKSYLLKGSVLQNRFVIGQDGNREVSAVALAGSAKTRRGFR